jgi:tRNA pseudouridine13 synthase
LLRKEYEYAAKTLVGVPGLEEGSTKVEKKLKYLENNNIELLSDVVYGEYEKRVIKHLSKNKSDYKGAMMKLHPSLLRLFIEAFSCYVFNLLVSGIIKKSGIKNVTELSEEGFFIVPLDKYFAQIEAVAKNEGKIKRAVSQNIKEKKAALAVAIPGYLTGEALTEEMRKILNFFKVDPKMFFVEEKPEVSYPGQYRAIVSYVKEFYFSNLSNNAIELEFFLPRGSFATVLLRELVRNHSTLTKNL